MGLVLAECDCFSHKSFRFYLSASLARDYVHGISLLPCVRD
jgi:hypothetical protein